MLQCVAVCCSVLQCVALSYRLSQGVAVREAASDVDIMIMILNLWIAQETFSTAVRCVVVCCRVLQCVAVSEKCRICKKRSQ